MHSLTELWKAQHADSLWIPALALGWCKAINHRSALSPQNRGLNRLWAEAAGGELS